jgi:hypothetical protein
MIVPTEKKAINTTKQVVYIFISIFCFSGICYGQTTINGVVLNNNEKPVADASVTLMLARDSTIVAFNFSNTKGEFTIRYHGNETSLLLGVSGFNIRRLIQEIEDKNKPITVYVQEEAIELQEFSLKAPKIWGGTDTINYSVGAFRDSTDLVIGDVLKKLPGITVRESGQIEYKGKPISKFYIENMDMMQGRYGIATNSISASDIATVQVFENHQPIKALKDIAFSDNAALNLILKPEAKGIFSAMAEPGAGSNPNLLWNHSLTGMYFSKSRQHLTALKSNNSGHNLEQEFLSFYNQFVLHPPDFSSMIIPAPPPISKNRYLFNEAYGGTVNNLFKTRNDAELTLNFNGFRDVDDREGFSQTHYFIPDADTVTISERLNSFTQKTTFEGGLGYKNNTPHHYLNTLFQTSFSMDESTGKVFGQDLVSQNDQKSPFRLTNTLHWVRRDDLGKRKGYEVNSRSWYQSAPNTLDVSPGMFSKEINNNKPFNTLRQNINFQSFFTQNSMMFLTSGEWKSVSVRPVLLLSYEYQSLSTQMFASQQDNQFKLLNDVSLQNNMTWMRLKSGMGFYFQYRKRDFNIMVSTPVQYQHLLLVNHTNSDANKKSSRIVFHPSANFKYQLTTRWDVSGSAFMYNHNPDLKNLFPGLILQDYRTLTHYENKLSDTYGQQGQIQLSYKNVLQFLFANAEISYNRYRTDVMYAQQFEGSAIKITMVEMKNRGDYLSVIGRMGKGFDWKKLSFNAEGSWGSGSTPQLRQDNLIQLLNQGLNANITISMEPAKRFILVNKSSTGRMTMQAGGEAQSSPLFHFINATSATYVFGKGLMGSLGGEYYYRQDNNRQQNYFLLDAQMVYTVRRIRFTLDINNVLNAQNYIYSWYGNLNSYYSEYRIRPASVLLSARFKLY